MNIQSTELQEIDQLRLRVHTQSNVYGWKAGSEGKPYESFTHQDFSGVFASEGTGN